MTTTIALLGQPNAGKSTLYNALTGAHQHTGNWPGKTVEQKSGSFQHNGKHYTVIDLPGSYSLAAHSEEEKVTRDVIASDAADLVCLIVDASQLSRSLYMLADYAGIKTPTLLLLNMMDVAEAEGLRVDCATLTERLGIPVLPFVATDRKGYGAFYVLLEKPEKNNWQLRDEKLATFFREEFGPSYDALTALLPSTGIGRCSRGWLACKLIEGDPLAAQTVRKSVDPEIWTAIQNACEATDGGNQRTGSIKFRWIDQLLDNCVHMADAAEPRGLNRFDRLATSPIWGKPLALGAILCGLFLSLIAGAPLMMIGGLLPSLVSVPLTALLEVLQAPPVIVSLLCDGVLSAVSFAFLMCGFVFGTSLVFGLAEDVGYMARIAYVFDHTMQRLGLHGKAIMPFLVSFGCNIGGATGTRVLDTWGQRALTIALSWVVPCSSTWAVVGLIASLFFGFGAIFVILSLFLVAFLHLLLTAKVFARDLLADSDRSGLIMELPPHHRPHWRALFRTVFSRMGEVLTRALKIITCASLFFWALSYTNDGVIENSLIYSIGTAIEPVTMWFGLRWQLFMAWLSSCLGKESCLGVLASLFQSQGIWTAIAQQKSLTIDTASVASGLLATINKAEALAFIYAFFFNMPCLIAFSSAVNETHSWKWMIRVALYYVAVSLLLAATAYHIGLLIF